VNSGKHRGSLTPDFEPSSPRISGSRLGIVAGLASRLACAFSGSPASDAGLVGKRIHGVRQRLLWAFLPATSAGAGIGPVGLNRHGSRTGSGPNRGPSAGTATRAEIGLLPGDGLLATSNFQNPTSTKISKQTQRASLFLICFGKGTHSFCIPALCSAVTTSLPGKFTTETHPWRALRLWVASPSRATGRRPAPDGCVASIRNRR
jgi:hypothetical protein